MASTTKIGYSYLINHAILTEIIMPKTLAQQQVTFEDFCFLVKEGQKADLIDGVIYMASPDNIQHYDINSWYHAILRAYLRSRKIEGCLFGYRIAFRLNEKNGPEPDVAYLLPEHCDRIRKTYIDGPPDHAVEIVSPSSVERDYEDKRNQYEQAGVAEYWIIDPLEERMTCYRLGKDSEYKDVRVREGKIHSHVIPGFWVKPAWFWQSPLPDEDEVLREILSTANGKS
jgi:Uma2 family endonuclease